MGYTWEVETWVAQDPEATRYAYEQVYAGESLLRALWCAWKAKRGSGCVRLSWR